MSEEIKITKGENHTRVFLFMQKDLSEMTKQEKIDAYEISIRPFEDCCTIFTPKNPVTKPILDKAIEYESKFDYQSLIDEILDNIETKNIYKENKTLHIFAGDFDC